MPKWVLILLIIIALVFNIFEGQIWNFYRRLPGVKDEYYETWILGVRMSIIIMAIALYLLLRG